MKKRFLKWSLNLIKNNNPSIDDIKLDEIRYGLEGIYLTITKTIFIFTICYLLNIFKEMILLLLFFNILRTTGFGLHAKKSWMCWLSSTIMFVILPLLAKNIIIQYNLKLFLGIFSIILIFLYAPADTEKRPLINKKKRIIWKVITTINCTILVIFSLITKEIISNLIIFGIYSEIILISPLTYKIFHLNYNNYKEYILKNNLS